MDMLQVRLNLQDNLFQPMSVCFNLGQLVSTQVSLGQVQNTLQVIVLPIEKVS